MTVLPEDKVVFEKKEVGSSVVLQEGRITHTHGQVAALGKTHWYELDKCTCTCVCTCIYVYVCVLCIIIQVQGMS